MNLAQLSFYVRFCASQTLHPRALDAVNGYEVQKNVGGKTGAVLGSERVGSADNQFGRDAACCVFARVFRGDIRAALLWELCGRRSLAYLSSPNAMEKPRASQPILPRDFGSDLPLVFSR